MNTKAFLRDWKPGDVLTADALQALTDAVAMLEVAPPGGGGSTAALGARRALSDGPQEWPWQVYAVRTAEGVQLRYVPGAVLVGQHIEPAADDESWPTAVHDYATPPAGEDVVLDFDAASREPSTIWLELTGVALVENVVSEDGYACYQHVALQEAALRVTCTPVATALRQWPLAVYTPGHAQPLTQLLWGDLSALECNAVLDAEGAPLWPTEPAAGAPAWGAAGHEAGMATLASADFSTAAETIEGELHGVLDNTGALELYLGPWPDGGDPDPGPGPSPGPGPDPGPGPWIDPDPGPDPGPDPDPSPDPDDDPPPPGPVGPIHPPGDNDPPDRPTRVRYGYVAGEGFLSCDLVEAGDGQLYWHLVLSPSYLASICAGLKVPATVTFEGDGTVPAANGYSVEMGLGSCTASATGMSAMGTAQLLFHATNTVDVSKKRSTVKVTFEASPAWAQTQEWYLSPRKLHKPGSYVYLDKGTSYSDPWIQAYQWYRWRVNKAAFVKAAKAYFKQQLGAVTLADSGSSTSYDAQVSATLTGTALKPTITLTLHNA